MNQRLCCLAIALASVAARAELTAEERLALEGEKCKPFVELFKKASAEAAAKSKETNTPMGDLVGQAVLDGKGSTGLSDADFTMCNTLLRRSLEDFRAKSIEGEARVNVKMIAKGFARVFDEDKKWCPTPKTPAPAELSLIQKGDYRFTKSDWADPAWECLYWDPSDQGRQRFQYELKADAKKKTFEVIARGYPYGDERLVTYSMTGKVEGKAFKLSELQRR